MLSKMMLSVDDRNKVVASSRLLRCQLTFSCVCRSVVIGVHKSSFHWCRCENNHSIQPWISPHAKTSANHQGVSLITSPSNRIQHSVTSVYYCDGGQTVQTSTQSITSYWAFFSSSLHPEFLFIRYDKNNNIL